MARKREPPTLEERVKHFIQEHNLLPSKSCLLVAVSGGPDSVCLLHILVGLKEKLGLKLHVAHLDHQLRGAESRADARYVAGLARRLGVSATIKRRDVTAYHRQHHVSLEEAAREVRYSFLADTAGAMGTNLVAVGHTRDDHIETILMHLIRGTGTRGLRGLQPLTVLKLPQNGGSLTVVRPLLEVSRRETADYCRSHRLRPRIDASNLSLSPLRNRIRLELLPLLESYNPQVAEALLRMAGVVADDLAFLDEEGSRLWGEIAQRQGSTIILAKEALGRLHPALKRHLLRVAIEELLGNLKDIEARHIEEIMTALDKPAGKRICLPRGLVFTIEYDRFLLGPEPAVLSPFPVLEDEFALHIPGETRLPGWQVEASIIDRKGESERGFAPLTNLPPPFSREGDKGGGLPNNLTACLDLDKSGDKLVVRSRRPGDRFQPLGLSQPKKLNEFMIDAKIPRAWRDRVPIVCSPEHILWLVGWRLDERVKVTDSTKQVLCLEFKKG